MSASVAPLVALTAGTPIISDSLESSPPAMDNYAAALELSERLLHPPTAAPATNSDASNAMSSTTDASIRCNEKQSGSGASTNNDTDGAQSQRTSEGEGAATQHTGEDSTEPASTDTLETLGALLFPKCAAAVAAAATRAVDAAITTTTVRGALSLDVLTDDLAALTSAAAAHNSNNNNSKSTGTSNGSRESSAVPPAALLLLDVLRALAEMLALAGSGTTTRTSSSGEEKTAGQPQLQAPAPGKRWQRRVARLEEELLPLALMRLPLSPAELMRQGLAGPATVFAAAAGPEAVAAVGQVLQRWRDDYAWNFQLPRAAPHSASPAMTMTAARSHSSSTGSVAAAAACGVHAGHQSLLASGFGGAAAAAADGMAAPASLRRRRPPPPPPSLQASLRRARELPAYMLRRGPARPATTPTPTAAYSQNQRPQPPPMQRPRTEAAPRCCTPPRQSQPSSSLSFSAPPAPTCFASSGVCVTPPRAPLPLPSTPPQPPRVFSAVVIPPSPDRLPSANYSS